MRISSSQMMISKNIGHILSLTILILLGNVQSIELYTLNSDGNKIDIIKQDKIQGSWDYQPSNGHMCRPAPTIIEKLDNQSRQFTIFNEESDNMSTTFSIKQFNSKLMKVQSNEAKGFTTLKSGESKMINVSYECKSLEYDDEENWARVEFSLEIKRDTDSYPNIYYFSLLKVCAMPPQKYDLSIFILMLVSVILVAFGAYQVESPIIVEDVEQTQEVSKKHAFLFILGGSFFLVLMFFLYEYLEVILTIMILISAHSSMSLLFNEILEKAVDASHCHNPEFDIPLCGKMNVSFIISASLALGVCISYAITKNWMLSNFIAFCIVMLMFKVVRLPSYAVALLLLGLAFLYDIFWVFYSDRLFGTSVMANVATKVELPMMFYCPKINLSPIQSCSLIGLGDIVLPGIFVSFCLQFSRRMNSKNHYYLTCLGGYISGILICVLCLTVFNTAQPALLYLSPCTLIPVAIHALIKGEFSYIWNGAEHLTSDLIMLNQNQKQNTAFESLELGEDQDQSKHKQF